MTGDEKKRAVATAEVAHVPAGIVLGVGTGSTVDLFIDELARQETRIEAAVASSVRSAERLERHGFRVIELNDSGRLPLYVDGADEALSSMCLIKGGGGALTREKIVAAGSDRFVCIVDDSKLVRRLGAFPLPIEVIPMAVSLVGEQLRELGGEPRVRDGFTTDNGNPILDVHGLQIENPVEMEDRIETMVGVVASGLFCRRPADLLLIGGDGGVEVIPPP